MDTDHIREGRLFRSLSPYESTTIRVIRYAPGATRVDVADTRGKNPRSILASSLRPSATKPNGSRYRSGYAPADDRT
ncbi:hypothetical protein F4561_002624 [Lipingzhangella halophila]|uniref:Uncharacterized protein n=1 Tax=Lipingzhangella halophila TaxID=1783352 RepID=A0A7W7RH10_9ACTN|nr:hypothetical protein [Lipingzhangella halophila]MBB4931804.1 hypothetical protein [Lipingzhangella halophila]